MLRNRIMASTLLILLASVALVGCGDDDELARPSEEFCQLAYEYDRDIARIGPEDPEGHLVYLEPMRELAPEDIRADLDRLTQAMRQVRDGDDSVVDDPEVEAAGRRFYNRAIDGCRLHDQEPPGGF